MSHITQTATLPIIDQILALKRDTAATNLRDLTKLCTSILESRPDDPENSPATRPTATFKLETISRQLGNFPPDKKSFIPRITEIFKKVLEHTYDHPADINIINDEAVFIRDHIVTHIEKIPGVVPLLTYYLMSCKKAAIVALSALAAASSLDAEPDIREATPTPSPALPISHSAGLSEEAPQSPIHGASAPILLPTPPITLRSRSAFTPPLPHHSPSPSVASQRPKSSSPPKYSPIVQIPPHSVAEQVSFSEPSAQPSSRTVLDGPLGEPPKLISKSSHHAYTVVSPRTSFDRMYSSIYSFEKANGLCPIVRNTLRVATWIVTFITPLFLVMGIWWACSKSTCISKGRVSQEPPLLVSTLKATRT